MTSADKWLKQELDELEKAQKMINDAISTFDDPTPYIESQGICKISFYIWVKKTLFFIFQK